MSGVDVSVGNRLFKISHVLMIVARTVGGLVSQGTIGDIERDLTKVIEDFDRAVNVEALRSAKKTGEHLFLAVVHSHLLRAEEAVLLGRLEPVKTSYHQDFRCIPGTREFLLKKVTSWATKEPGREESNTYWIYGLPGIGKTWLAHSICASLDEENHLAGAFFCRRDDKNLSEPRNILPTLIHKLAIFFPPFRHVVAKRLGNNPNLMPGSMSYSFLLELIRKLPRHPKRTLVFVIDAIDECGDALSRPEILRSLTNAAAHAWWLKIIITSRPEGDIVRSFDALVRSSYERYDLTEDKDAPSDLRIFAEERFRRVASKRRLRSPWPEPPLFDRVISRAEGLFVFIETIARAIEKCENHPTEHLKATLEDSGGAGLTSLYGLYSSILKTQIEHNTAKFRQMIGVLLAAAPYRPLCEETLAELAGVRLDLVEMWVEDLGSLLYRDEGANGGIRVRHLSISDFFLRDCHSDYHVDLRDVNVELGIACLKKMIEQLRFNICKLEDSRRANVDIHDLSSRIKENISDALQYSSLYWSTHLCFDGDNGDERIWENLRKFFEGPYGLFWIEVLSIMGMVSIGVPSLRRVMASTVKVSTGPTCDLKVNLIWGRMSI